MERLMRYVRELCALPGVSGAEDAVRAYITEHIEGKCEYRTDALGSVIAYKPGQSKEARKVMFDAHMDEVGVIATHVGEDGFVRFDTVGGVNPAVLAGKRVRFPSGAYGVIGIKPIHLTGADDRGKLLPAEKLFIDVGADDKAGALERVCPGDVGVFDCEYALLGEHRVRSKALDDRIGCAVMLRLIDEELPCGAWFSFAVQEEIGLRGAKATGYAVQPDYAVVLEATTAADLPGADGAKAVCRLGEGAVVSFMDRRTVYDAQLYARVRALADRENIPNQTKTMIAGGNDAGVITGAGVGVRTTAVSVPCRYIHSPGSVCDVRDIEAVWRLSRALLPELGL